MRTQNKYRRIHRSRATLKRSAGQAMIEYVAVASGLFLAVIGSHSAYEAFVGNRVGISEHRGSGQNYENVTSVDGNSHSNSVSMIDAIQERKTTFREKIAELSF